MSDLTQTLRDRANEVAAYADKLVEVLDYVWCDKEGDVHHDTLNPHGYNESIPDQDLCKPEDHHKLYREVTP